MASNLTGPVPVSKEKPGRGAGLFIFIEPETLRRLIDDRASAGSRRCLNGGFANRFVAVGIVVRTSAFGLFGTYRRRTDGLRTDRRRRRRSNCRNAHCNTPSLF
jgi:hypothetical protein